MYRNFEHNLNKKCLKLCEGSSLVIAIFIIVVLSALGAALVNILESSDENVAFEVIGTRAYSVAQTGVQWKLAQIFPLGQPAQDCPVDGGEPDVSTVTGIADCSFSAICTSFVNNGIRYYTITSTGQCNLNGVITSRRVEVEARSL